MTTAKKKAATKEPAPPTTVAGVEALLTRQDVAKLLGVSLRTVDNMRIPSVLLPGSGETNRIRRYDPAELRAWIEARKTSRVARLSRAS